MRSPVVRRLGYALGAELTGIESSRLFEPETIETIGQVLLEHVVVCIPGQPLDAARFKMFCGLFGELDDHRRTPQGRHPSHDEVVVLSNKPLVVEGRKLTGYGVGNKWHSDLAYTEHPSTLTFLLAKELPSIGGNTLFANMYTAFETLSAKLQELIRPLEGVHDVALGPTFLRNSPQEQQRIRELNPPVAHPLVRVHAATGKPALYAGERIRNFAGFSAEETKPLLDFLNAHATRHEFLYRHRWSLDDLVIWDNRCSMHFAVPDYDQRESRNMLRCSLVGPRTGRIVSPSGGEPASAAASGG